MKSHGPSWAHVADVARDQHRYGGRVVVAFPWTRGVLQPGQFSQCSLKLHFCVLLTVTPRVCLVDLVVASLPVFNICAVIPRKPVCGVSVEHVSPRRFRAQLRSSRPRRGLSV